MSLGLRWLILATCLMSGEPKKGVKSLVESISEHKDLKKLLRTKNNVLILYSASDNQAKDITSKLVDVSQEVKGLATLVSVRCGDKEGKKLCKKMKVSPEKYILKHYKDGDFNKDYDRAETVKSLATFLKDPTGDLPWEEDPAGSSVVHFSSPGHFDKFLKGHLGPVLVMFYAPWCGHCKRLKPDYQALAAEMKGSAILAAMDVNKPENSPISRRFNITGFPTILYFEEGGLRFPYPGGNSKQEIKKFLENPKAEAEEKPKEVAWSDEASEVLHLTDATFDQVLAAEPSLLIMFYAPWCGHCKRAKPHFNSAAEKMKNGGIKGKLAAVDCTKETAVSKRFQVKGFPTIKYFKNGDFAFDAGDAREEAAILKFMKDPSEPPKPPPPETPWAEEPSEVVHLTESSFKPFLKKKKHVLVMFYAPWCGHCKTSKPQYTAAAEQFKDDTKVEFVAVDCTMERGVCSAHSVSGFPTFKYFNYYTKQQKDYEGGRTTRDFVKFMSDPQSKGAGQPPPPPSPEEEWAGLPGALYVKHLVNAEFEDYLRFKDTVLVMFYAPWCGHCKNMKPEYTRAAMELTNAAVPHVLATVDATVERELGSRFNIKGYPTLKLFRRGKEVETYTGGRKSADFVKYIRQKVAELRDEL